MATDLVMPRMPDFSQQHNYFQHPAQQFHQQQYQHQQYQQQQFQQQYQQQQQQQQAPYHPQISPLSTSNNASPTSPKSYHTRQLRPLYMPAVLRPNEHPSKEPPVKAKPENQEEDEQGKVVRRSSGSFISLPGLGTLGIGRLSRRSTSDSGKCLDGSWNLDLFPEVKGLPSRSHWKPDPESTICDEPTCKRHFSYFTRRHHCRRCGNIFCDSHSGFEIPLDENANYNPRGSPSRSCAHCFGEFKAWRSRTNSQASSDASSTGHGAGGLSSPITATPAPLHPGKTPEAAQSVPSDWTWSTF